MSLCFAPRRFVDDADGIDDLSGHVVSLCWVGTWAQKRGGLNEPALVGTGLFYSLSKVTRPLHATWPMRYLSQYSAINCAEILPNV